MTKNPITGSPEMEICEASRIIGENGFRRIPIVENERAVGILSIADVVEHARACSMCNQNIMNEIEKTER